MTDTRDNKQKKDARQQQRSRKQECKTPRERTTASEKSAAASSAKTTAAAKAVEPDLDLGRRTMAAREQLARRLMRLAAEAKETWRGCARRACRRAKTCRGEPPLPCLAAHKGPPLSPEESAWVAADILRALRAQRQRLAAAGLVEEMEE